MNCPICKGRGKVNLGADYYGEETCSLCKGEGTVTARTETKWVEGWTCAHCEGKGYTSYRNQAGTWKETCTYCNGRGGGKGYYKTETYYSPGGSPDSNGCFITSATLHSLKKEDNCYELNKFREFRDNWLNDNYPDLIKKYYLVAPKIVANIEKLPNYSTIYEELWNKYLKKCLSFIENQDYELATETYRTMVLKLKNIYL